MAVLGTVVSISGPSSEVNHVYVMNARGEKRPLHMNDTIQPGDTIITPPGVIVELQLANGKVVDVFAEQEVKFTQEFADAVPPSSGDSAVDRATIQAVIKAVNEGRDISDVLEESAAGVDGGSSNDDGFGFVNLLRIVEGVNPLAFQFDTSRNGTVTIEPLPGNPDDANQSGPSDLTLSATPSITEAGGNIIYTATLSHPAVSATTVTLSNGLTVLIPQGATTGTATLTVPPGDDVYKDPSTVSATVTGVTGSGTITINPTPAVTTITDTIDTTTVTLSATPTVAEGGNIVYTATLSNPAQTAVTVTLSTGEVINIAAGASTGSVTVAAPTDDVYIDAGSVSKTITSATGGNFEQLTVNPAAASTTVTDTIDATTVSITGSASVTEGGTAAYTVSLTSPAQTAVTVNLTYTGTAINGTDYTGVATVTIPAGASSANFNIATINDALAEGTENITVAIASATGGNFESLVVSGTNGSTTTNLIDDDVATCSLTATPSITEAGGTIVYTATISQAPVSNLTVTLSNGSTITILAGQTTGTVNVPIAASDDPYVDPSSISATITNLTGGGILTSINPTPAVTSVTDTIDTTTVTLSATPTVAEGGNIVYTATLSNPAQTAVTVTLSTGEVINIAAGASTGSVTVAAPTDDVYIDAGSVSKTITSATGGNFEQLTVNPAAASTTVTDTINPTTVTLSATPTVAEGGNIVYTATLSNPAQTAVTVTLSTGEVINIAAGASTGSVTVAAPTDDVYIDAGSVSKTITSATGGNFEQLTVNPAAASTTVTDTIDATTVSITGSASVTEGGTAAYTVSLTSPAQTAVTVNLTYTGTAINGTDYTGVATVTIPAGASSANFNIATINDALAEGTENITVAIASATGGNFESLVVSGTNGSTTTNLIDDDVATCSLTATPSITEAGGTIVYTATISQAPVSNLTVTLSNGSTITILAGQTTGTVNVPVAASDDPYVDPSSISATITNLTGGGILTSINPTPAVTSVTDTIDTTTVSITGNASVTEGSTGTYTVSLTHPAQTAVTVNLTYTGTAANGSDYTGVASVTIPAGASSATFNIATIDDNISEGTETLIVNIVSATGGNFENLVVSGTNGSVTTNLVDNDPAPTVTISGAPDVNEAIGTVTYTVTLSNPSSTAVTVNYGTANGTATAGSDYTATSGVITFAPGETTKTFTVAITDDTTYEGNETYTVSLSAPSGATLGGTSSVTTTIHDDGTGTTTDPSHPVNPPATDDRPQVGSVTSPTITEGGNLDFLVTLTHASTTPTTVTLTPASGTATLGTDTNAPQISFDGVNYSPLSGTTVTVPAGATSFTVRYPTVNDNITEPTETMTLGAATAQNAAPIVGTGTITDNDPAPTVTISGAPDVNEAIGTVTYTVTLSNPSSTAVTVNYGTANGTATAGSDYTATSGVITFAPGETTKTFTVAITDDTTYEGNETYTVSLSAPSGATLGGTSSVTTTIHDDGTGTTTDPSHPVNPPATDDRPQVGSVTSPTITEGGNLDFLVTLTHASTTPTTVTLTPASGTATLGTDTNAPQISFDGVNYSPLSGTTVTVPAGATSFTVRYPTVNDNITEPTETMTLGAATAQNAAPIVGTGTITDNDPAPTVTISGAPDVNEAIGTVTYTVTLSNPSSTAVTVNYGTANGTATAGSDYTATSGVITFAPGETTKTFTVAITDDTTYEGNETYTVSLSAPSGATLGGTSSVTTTIHDDGTGTTTDPSHPVNPPATDDRPQVGSVTSPTITEGGNLDFLVTLTHASTTPTTVTLTPASGTATLGTDTNAPQISFDGVNYSPLSGTTVTVPAGATSFTVRYPTVNDNITEPTETMTLGAATAQNAAPIVGTGTITDNDPAPTVTISGAPDVNEAIGTVTYTVTLSNPSSTAVTVNYGTANGTATAGSDYTATSGVITFAPGETTKTFTVAITDDTTYEGNETYTVSLSAPSGATLGGTSSVTTTIHDDGTGTTTDPSHPVNPPATDDRPQVGSVTSPTITEGGNLDFLVTLTHASTTPTTVTLTPASGTATLGTDTNAPQISFDGGVTFSALSGTTVTVPAGATSFIVRYPTVDDNISEPTETMTLGAATAQNAAPIVGTGTITDNDPAPTVTISGAPDVNEAIGTVTYTVTLSNPSSTAVTVNYGTANGTATAGSDYTATSGVITFAPGETTKTFTVAITDDTTYEGNETYTVSLSAPSGATLGGTSSVTTTIHDDGTGTTTDPSHPVNPPATDDRPQVGSVTSPTITEGGNLDFLVTLTHASTTPTTVTLTPASGTATLGTDTNAPQISFDGVNYSPLSGTTVTVPAGATSFTVRYPTVNDNITEPTETMTLGAATAQNAAPIVGTGTITDNDPAPTVTISGAPDVNEAIGTVTYTVTLSNPSSTAVTVNYGTANGTATAGSDYTATSGVITFAPGETTKTFTVAITDDTTYEGNETYTVSLSAPSGATLGGTSSVTTTIHDDGTGTTTDPSHPVNPPATDDRPQVGSVTSPTITEGGNLDFLVTLTHASTTPTTVTLTPASGTATLGTDTNAPQISFDGVNYSPLSGTTVTVPAGATSFTVRYPTVNDNITEPTETMTLGAATAQNAAPIVGTGTITDNDPAPTVTISGAPDVNEAIGTVTYTVTLSNPSSTAVTVNYGTANGTATAGSDYTATSGVITFAPGETTKTFTVAITDDTTYEGNETYTVSLSAPSGATLGGTSSVTTTIHDDGTGTTTDPSHPVNPPATDDRPQVGSVTSPTITEGGNLDFLVTLTHASTTPTTVTLTPASGTATLGTDTNAPQVSFDGGVTFSALSGTTVTVPAGATSFIVRYPTVDDNISEPTETMTLGAATAQNAAPIVGTGTITDNDPAPTVTISGAPDVNEAIGTVTYTVTLSNPSSTAVTVNYGTANGTATAGSDYTATSGVITFAPGETTKTFTVAITDDTTYEGNETYTVSLSAPSGATLGGTSSVTTTIHDDGTGTTTDPSHPVTPPATDDRPQVGSVSSPTVAEGSNLDFTVTLTHPSTTATTVTLTPASGTATLGTDTNAPQVSFDGGVTFSALSGTTVTVPAGATSFIVRYPTVDDTLSEGNETMTLAAATAQNPTAISGTGTIVDNDPNVDLDGNDSSGATGSSYTTTFTENGTAVSIADTDVVITDTISTTMANATITLTNAKPGDVLAVGSLPSGITATVVGNVVTLSGVSSLANYQTAIHAITFANTTENPDTTARTISVVLSDGTNITNTAIATVNVTAVNDAPVNTLPASYSTNEDAALKLSGLSIADVDAGSGSMTVTLSVASGTLTAATAGSVTVTGSGTGTITLSGTLANINTYLATVANQPTFTPVANANGTVALTMTTSDNGNTGTGGTLTDTDTINITVNAVNDAPVNTLPASFTTNEDTSLSLTGLAISDVDAGSGSMTVTLSVASGTLTATTGSGVTITNSGTSSITLSGTLANINSYLASASAPVYVPVANANGAVTLTMVTNDNGNTGSGGALSDTDTSTINITAVNDAPVNTVPAAQTTNEDTSKAITGLSISDVDAGSGSMTVTLAVTNGTLTVTGGTATITGSTTNTVTLTGTVAQINATLAANVTYVPTANFNGSATLTMTTNDNGNTGTGGALTDADTVTITVNSVNDAPAGTDKTITTNEDTGYTFTTGDFGFTDPNDTPANTLLAVKITTLPTNGTLTLSGVAVTAGQVISAANIGNLVFTPSANANGNNYANFTFQVQDNGGTANGGIDLDPTPNTITFNVTAVNDAPVNTLPASYSTNEDTALKLSGLSIADVDAGSGSMTVTLSVASGTLTAATAGSVTVTGSGTGTITLSGTLANINTYLATVANQPTFTPVANANGTVALTMTTSDNGNTGTGGTLTDTDTINITVNAVNDAPVNTLPASFTTNEDTSLSLTGLAISDVDAGSGSMTVTLSVASGTLTATTGSGVTITNSGTSSITLSGTLANINSYLASASAPVYVPVANANGAVTLTMVTNDNGNTGSGGALSDTDTSTINITAVNDAPVNTVPAAQTTNEDTSKAITGLSISDVDAGSGSMTVTLAVTNGTLTVTGGTATITGSTTNTVTLTGTVAQINATLAANVTYVPTANFNGSATLTMTTNDNGNTGTGGALTDADTVTITVNSVNDAPAGTDKTITTNEDTGYTFTTGDFGFTDPNDTPANTLLAVKITTLPTNGTLTLSGVAVTAGQVISAANIGNLVFTPSANANGNNYANFTFQVQDNGGTANGGIDLDPTPNTITFNVTAVNDAPVNTLPASYSTNEDTALKLSGLSIADVDAGSGSMTVTLSVASGTLTAATAGSVTVTGSGTGTITLSGTLANINTYLATVANQPTFTPVANANGTVALTMTTSDNGNTGTGGALTDVDTRNINIVAVADAPTVTTATSVYTRLDFNGLGTGQDIAIPTSSAWLPSGATWKTNNTGGQFIEVNPSNTAYGIPVGLTGATSNVMELERNTGDASNLYYDFNTTAGATYVLTFDFSPRSGQTSITSTGFTSSAINVRYDSSSLTPQTGTVIQTVDSSTVAWQRFTITLTGTGNPMRLEFDAVDGNATTSLGGLLDNISLASTTNVGGVGTTFALQQPTIALTDTDGSESITSINIAGIQVGATISDGSHTFTATAGNTIADVTSWNLSTLTYQSSTAGTFNLTVSATSTETSNGSSATTSTTMAIAVNDVIAGTTGADLLEGTGVNDNISGGNGDDELRGFGGNDLISGGAGNDYLFGDAGKDTLIGGTGNDNLTGGAGVDTFKWALNDQSTHAAVATAGRDTITDFNTGTIASGNGDILDLKDLLVGENAGTLDHYLHVTYNSTTGATIIQVNTAGGFTAGHNAETITGAGNFTSALADVSGTVNQQIVLTGVNLTSLGTTDAQIINNLIAQQKLITD